MATCITARVEFIDLKTILRFTEPSSDAKDCIFVVDTEGQHLRKYQDDEVRPRKNPTIVALSQP